MRNATSPALLLSALAVVLAADLAASSSSASSSSSSSSSLARTASPYVYDPTTAPPPLSLTSGMPKLLARKWNSARTLALLEQTVEDYNAEIVATAPDPISAMTYRRLIVLPLDERFDPPVGMFSHGHVQTGDKMSLPKVFWNAIAKKSAEVPWLFEVSRVDGVTGPRHAPFPPDEADPNLVKAVGGAIDFRSPSNYVFLPHWMMRSLALRPRDVVDVRLVEDTPPGSAVKLRPHSSDFVSIRNHQAVLETELKHYSSLTKGATIPFDYNGRRYMFDVVDLRSAPRGEKVDTAKVQDCDIAAEFLKARDRRRTTKGKSKKQDQ